MSKPLVPSLMGATGSGKTAVAIQAARLAGLEILSADSRQVYRGFRVGTAMPTDAERATVPHHLIDFVDPRATYSAAEFGRDARAAADEVRTRGQRPFLVGGSGLYLRAAERGLFEGPPADREVREALTREAETEGAGALHARLAAVDPTAARRLAPEDRVRVVRALEVHALTGVPLTEHHRRHREQEIDVRPLRFGLDWEPAALRERLEERLDTMIESGWEDEVRDLLEAGVPPDAPAFGALGYREVLAVVRGELPREAARERIRIATRRFAKRQRTWFRAVENVTWLRIEGPEDLEGVGPRIAEGIARAAGSD